MAAKQMIMAFLGTILKVALYALVIMFIYRAALVAYDYGYRIFQEGPMTEAPGRDVTVEITMGKSTLQVGELLEQNGLIRDARLFYIQNLLSRYKDKLRPGVYTLNTSMTMEEMMEVLSYNDQAEETESTE